MKTCPDLLTITQRSPLWKVLAKAILSSCGHILVWQLGTIAAIPSEGSQLPLDAQQQFTNTSKAMTALGIEYRQIIVGGEDLSSNVTISNAEYFDGKKFYQFTLRSNQPNTRNQEVSSDGITFCLGFPDRDDLVTRKNILTKYSISDKTDPGRFTKYMEFSYLDSAGFYAPIMIAELEHFNGLVPLVIHSLQHSDSTQVERTSEGFLRVKVRIPDRFLLSLRKLSVDEQETVGAFGVDENESLTNQLRELKVIQKMEPKRQIVFVLDPKLGYGTVEREELTSEGDLILRVKSDGWTFYEDPGIWMPSKSYTSYERNPLSQQPLSASAARFKTNELVKIEFHSFQDKAYSLDYTMAGAIINDRTSTQARKDKYHQVSYRIDADGSKLRMAAGGVSVDTRDRKLYSILFIVLAILPGYWLVRRFRRHNG